MYNGSNELTEEDIADLATQRKRVLNLMKDGNWHNGPDIVAVAGGSEGLRRLRELRERKGVFIEKQRIPKARVWRYRMVVTEGAEDES